MDPIRDATRLSPVVRSDARSPKGKSRDVADVAPETLDRDGRVWRRASAILGWGGGRGKEAASERVAARAKLSASRGAPLFASCRPDDDRAGTRALAAAAAGSDTAGEEIIARPRRRRGSRPPAGRAPHPPSPFAQRQRCTGRRGPGSPGGAARRMWAPGARAAQGKEAARRAMTRAAGGRMSDRPAGRLGSGLVGEGVSGRGSEWARE